MCGIPDNSELPRDKHRAAFDRAPAIVGISGQQREVAWRLFRGDTLKRIAFDLGRERGTVRAHVLRAFSKFGVTSQPALLHAVYAMLDAERDPPPDAAR